MNDGNVFCPIPQALDDLRAGRLIVLVDDESRENEGDLVCAAEKVTPAMVNFMLKYGRGVLCMPLTQQGCQHLNLHPQTADNTAPLGTAFMVTVDAHPRFGVTTGVSAADRATTIQTAIGDDAQPTDLVRPGHISPLQAMEGGVLVRAGQTEGSVDLARLAGLKPAAVLIEIMNEDGTMARVPDLVKFCRQHDLRMCTVADLVEYRLRSETLVERIETIAMPTRYGDFTLIAYRSLVDREPHLALCCGGVGERLTLAHSLAVVPGHLTGARWIEACCTRPAEIMGLGGRKGRLAPGYDADVVVFDPEPEYRWEPLADSDHAGSIWRGMPAKGRVTDVWLRGTRVVSGGRLLPEQPGGIFLPRQLS